jgi:DNA-binding CsgD family transcriptional regulator
MTSNLLRHEFLRSYKLFNEFFNNNLQCQDDLDNLRDIIRRNYGIDDFWHLTVYKNGLMANVSTYYDQWGYFWDNDHYKDINFLIAPSRLKQSYFLLDNDKEFMGITHSFKDKYPQHHPFISIRKEGADKAHIFGFASRRHTPCLPSFYINNLPILNSFLDYYLSSHTKFRRPKEEHMIDIAALRGHDRFYKGNYGVGSVGSKNHSMFFKQIGIKPTLLESAKSLSKREKQVLEGCYEGKTAEQIGNELGLSHRTIQSYLENSKNKLNIFSRDDLINCVKILKNADLLS